MTKQEAINCKRLVAFVLPVIAKGADPMPSEKLGFVGQLNQSLPLRGRWRAKRDGRGLQCWNNRWGGQEVLLSNFSQLKTFGAGIPSSALVPRAPSPEGKAFSLSPTNPNLSDSGRSFTRFPIIPEGDVFIQHPPPSRCGKRTKRRACLRFAVRVKYPTFSGPLPGHCAAPSC